MQKGIEVFDVSGKVALITGAAGYLGASMAWVLAEAGAHVIVNSRSTQRGDVLVKALVAEGYSAEAAIFDVTDYDAVNDFFIKREHSPLHILINNAYVGGAGSIELTQTEAYKQSYDVAVVSAHSLINAALPSLRKAVKLCADASVINLTSMYAMVSPDQAVYDAKKNVNPPFYGAVKAALLQWTRYAACEFGPEKIRVNAISPGPFPSNEAQLSNPDLIDKLAKKVPLGRIGLTDEIKGPTLFLASSASSFVNGSNIVVDGGWTCW